MRHLFIFLILLNVTLLRAQKFEFPKLAVQGSKISTLIPNNWKAIDTVYGDLNNDKQLDMVLVLEFDQPVAETRAYGDADTELIKEFQKPRIMAIYFKHRNRYAFALQNNNFILRAKEGGIYDDPYDGITIKNNMLNIYFKGGSNWRWKLDYQFKYEHSDWVLIHAKNRYYHNSSGEMDEKSYNFITRKVTETVGNLNTENANKVAVKELDFNEVRTLNTFKKPWTWEIRKDEFL